MPMPSPYRPISLNAIRMLILDAIRMLTRMLFGLWTAPDFRAQSPMPFTKFKIPKFVKEPFKNCLIDCRVFFSP